ncbi:MAG: dTDP-4-dehydrorhamnose reductase [Nostocoides sp.]
MTVSTGGPAPRWLVVGARGMLGTDLVAHLRGRGLDVTAASRADVDVTDPDSARAGVADHDVVVNCAAWTAVDAAESDEGAAFEVNAAGAANLARASTAEGARLVHISTDYVFPGDSARPYGEGEELRPRSAYGRTKAAGEWGVRTYAPDAIVLRVAWLYGAHGPNFVATMARLAGERDTVSVVADQHGQPTWTVDVCERITTLIDAGVDGGPWHATASGSTTWHGLAQAVFAGMGLDPDRVRAIGTEDYPLPAPRPAFSVLGHSRWSAAGLSVPRDWRAALDQALPQLLTR